MKNQDAVAYVRVSDRQQTRGESLADQERACREFATRQGLRVVKVFKDAGKSAWKDDLKFRPEFARLLGAPFFSAVIVYKLDRFARRARIYHNARWKLEQAGVKLLSATEPNEDNAAGRLSSGMLAQFAEFYSSQLSERIRTAKAGKAQRGEWIGDPPFGYLRQGRSIAPGPLWPWVVCIFKAYELGASSVDISRALNAAAVPLSSGKPWTKDSVLMVLHGRAYIGQGGGRALPVYQGDWRPLITPGLFEAVQERLQERKRRPTGPRRQRAAPLGYEALCGVCGGPMNRAGLSSGGGYLRCRASLSKQCAATGVRLDTVSGQLDLLRQAGTEVSRVWVKAPRGIVRFE